MSTLTHLTSQIDINAWIVAAAAIVGSGLQHYRLRSVNICIAKYPLFKYRDQLTKFYLDRRIPETVYKEMYKLANQALFVHDSVNLRNWSQAASLAEEMQKNAALTAEVELVAEYLAKDIELCRIFVGIVAHVLRQMIKNSVWQCPGLWLSFMKHRNIRLAVEQHRRLKKALSGYEDHLQALDHNRNLDGLFVRPG